LMVERFASVDLGILGTSVRLQPISVKLTTVDRTLSCAWWKTVLKPAFVNQVGVEALGLGYEL